MAKEILAGATNQTIDVFIPDSSSIIGAGLAGLAFDTASLTCYYRLGAIGVWTQLSLVTLALISTAHAEGGFKEGDATNAKGMYRLDLSDAMVATAGIIKIYLQGAANMAPSITEIEVVAVNKFDAVRMGMTALPNAAANAAGGLLVSIVGALNMDVKLANTNEITVVRMGALTDWINGGRLDLLLDAIPTTAMRGTDGANTVEPDPAGTAPTAIENREEMDSNSTGLAAIFGKVTGLDGDAMRGTDLAALATALVTHDGKLDTANINILLIKAVTDLLAGSAGTIVNGTAETGTLSITQMSSNLSESTNNHYNGRIIIWTSGVLKNQATDITAYVGVNGVLTFTAVTESPLNGDTFIIL